MRDGRIAYVDFGNVAELSQVSCVFQIIQYKVNLIFGKIFILIKAMTYKITNLFAIILKIIPDIDSIDC